MLNKIHFKENTIFLFVFHAPVQLDFVTVAAGGAGQQFFFSFSFGVQPLIYLATFETAAVKLF